jgi:hypothetical protein
MSSIQKPDLSSFNGIQHFLRHSPSIQQVLNHRPKEGEIQTQPAQALLSGRWSVCQWLTAPFRHILAFVLRSYAEIFSHCGAEALAVTLKNRADWLNRGFDEEVPKSVVKLMKSINRPSAEGNHLNEQSPLPTSDPRIQKRLRQIKPVIKFQHYEGICQGQVAWFLNLYLKTRHQFPDPQAHMLALGEQFKKGAGKEAVLLQSLVLKKGKILDLKIGMPWATIEAVEPKAGEKKRAFFSGGYHAHQLVAKDLLSKPVRTLCDFEDLDSGAYLLGFGKYGKEYGHATAWIKISDDLSYFFDPNKGIYEIRGTSQAKELFELFSSVFKYLRKGTNAKSDEGEIVFIPYSLRN